MYVGVDSEFIKKGKWKIEIKENVGNFSKVVQEKPSSENRGIKDRAKISRSKMRIAFHLGHILEVQSTMIS